MQGRRLPDGTPLSEFKPGDYAWEPYAGWEQKPGFLLGDGEWHLMDPTGRVGAVGRVTREKPTAHTVVIHDDGSITCHPSLVMPSGWHGWLQAGVWS